MYPLEDATTDNDAVAENTSAPVSLAAQPASAPVSTDSALIFLDTKIAELQLKFSNFDKVFKSYIQDRDMLTDCVRYTAG